MSNAEQPKQDDKALDDELEILMSDRQLTLNGEPVNVKEISFKQGLVLGIKVKPMIVELETLFEGENADPDMDELGALFAKHNDLFFELISSSIDRPIEWIEALNDTEGQMLTMTFWSVNRDFFTSRLVARAAQRAKLANLRSVPGKSSPP